MISQRIRRCGAMVVVAALIAGLPAANGAVPGPRAGLPGGSAHANRAGVRSAPAMQPGGGRPGTRPATPNLGPTTARPTTRPGGNVTIPQRPGPSTRPVSRPSPSLPGGGAVARPMPSQRPTLPHARPGGGTVQPPTTRPGGGGAMQLPGVRPGGGARPQPGDRPTTRPSLPSRPSRPGEEIVNRPGRPSRPGEGTQRPRPLPGERPEIERPDLGWGRPRPERPPNVQRPPQRPPQQRPPQWPDRPGGSHDRPNLGWTPGHGTRPPERPVVRPQRPYPGGWGNNTNTIVNNIHNEQNIYNTNNWFGGRWNQGYNSWAGNWQDHWYSAYVHPHHHSWYHGAWTGNRWTSFWTPLTLGLGGWGLSNFVYTSGYVPYSNPYVITTGVTPAMQIYNSPVEVANYQAEPAPQQDEALALFDQARAMFTGGDYRAARQLVERALSLRNDDPSMHEFYALTLFMTAEYQQAARVLNALLATAPGWDWTTMISLFGSESAYTQRLRRLESYCAQRPQEAGPQFLLAYHYIVCGETEGALKMLERVHQLEPNDRVAAQMLRAMRGDEADAPAPQAVAQQPSPGELDLTGGWIAQRNGDRIELEFNDQGGFQWQFLTEGGNANTIEGRLTVAGDVLVMESEREGNMVARATRIDDRSMRLQILGGPTNDEGMVFVRSG